MSFNNGELIAMLSACLAALSAIYARLSAMKASSANKIAIASELRPSRLAAYSSLRSFLDFGSTYYTMQCLNLVKGARAIGPRIKAFEWEILQLGPLDMPKVELLTKQSISKAWELQRITDRLLGSNPTPLDSTHLSAVDNRDAILDWFHSQQKDLQCLFDPYLRIAP